MKVGAIIFFVFVAYALFGALNYIDYGTPNASQDFAFHYARATGATDADPTYPSLFHNLFSFLPISTPFDFYLLNLFFIAVLIPITLYLATNKSAWSVAFYFFGISLPHLWIYGATYPQAFVFFLLIIYLGCRTRASFKERVILLAPLAIFAGALHSYGLVLFGLVALAELAEHYLKEKGQALGYLVQANFFDFSKLAEFFLFHLPAPLLYYGLKTKNVFYSSLFVLGLASGFADFRGASLAQIAILFACTQSTATMQPKQKKLLIFFLACMALFFFANYGLATLNLLKQ